MKLDLTHQLYMTIVGSFFLIVLLLDTVMPTGVFLGFLYVFPSIAAVLLLDGKLIVRSLVLLVGFLLAGGFFISPTDGEIWKELVNRAASFLVVGVTTVFCFFYKKMQSEKSENEFQYAKDIAANNKKLARSNEELEQFAYAASHDLKSPLVTISSFSRTILDTEENLSEQGRHLLKRILANAKHMGQLIASLLDFSRVTKQAVDKSYSNLAHIIRVAIEGLDAEISASSAEVAVGDNLPEIFCHQSQMIQLISNLLSNSIKYSAAGRLPMIRVECEEGEFDFVISIKDNGVGIPRDHQDLAFKLFERLGQSKEIPGNGLGLAICKSVVEKHGGRIFIDSTVGTGTTVTFSLPKA